MTPKHIITRLVKDADYFVIEAHQTMNDADPECTRVSKSQYQSILGALVAAGYRFIGQAESDLVVSRDYLA